MSDDGTIEVVRRDAVAVVTLNRPAKLNALTLQMIGDLRDRTEQLDADPDVRVIVVTGSGSRAFCAGGDLATLLPAAREARMDVLNPDPTQRFLSRVFTPVIAAVEGACIGGGFELLLGTDIRIAADNARFALPEVSRGLIAGSGSNVRLPRQVPWPIAMELLILGRPVTAARAYEVGLINEVVPAGTALDRALELAKAVSAVGPLAARTAKEIAVRSTDLAAGFVLEHALNSRVLGSDDAGEGIAAFHDKRDPDFSGH